MCKKTFDEGFSDIYERIDESFTNPRENVGKRFSDIHENVDGSFTNFHGNLKKSFNDIHESYKHLCKFTRCHGNLD